MVTSRSFQRIINKSASDLFAMIFIIVVSDLSNYRHPLPLSAGSFWDFFKLFELRKFMRKLGDFAFVAALNKMFI